MVSDESGILFIKEMREILESKHKSFFLGEWVDFDIDDESTWPKTREGSMNGVVLVPSEWSGKAECNEFTIRDGTFCWHGRGNAQAPKKYMELPSV